MEHQKRSNLLYEPNDSKFVTRKLNVVNDLSNSNDAGDEIIYNTGVLKSNLCDRNDAWILVRGDITVITAHTTQVSFKNCTPCTKCIKKIDGTVIDDAEDSDLVMPMYDLIKYSLNYSETTWWKDEATNFDADIANNSFKSFEYKTKLLGHTIAQPTPNQANGIL